MILQSSVPEPVTRELLDELNHISAYDPEQFPGEIKLVEEFGNVILRKRL